MYKDFIKTNALFIIIGLVLMIANIFLDLGILQSNSIQQYSAKWWIVNISSKITATVGLALIIGFLTKLINCQKEEEDKKSKEERYNNNLETLTTTINNSIANNIEKIYLSKEVLESLSEDKKSEVFKNCLPKNYTERQKEYFSHKINQIYNKDNTHIRSNIDYITTARKENGKVFLHTEMSYRIYKLNEDYPPITHIFDKQGCKIIEMTILYAGTDHKKKNKNKIVIKKEDLQLNPETIHQNETIYKNQVIIPNEIQKEKELLLKITVEEEGYDHWAHLVWMSLYPTDTISYKIICKDGLVIKDPHIFDNQNGLYYTHESKDSSGNINEYTINCDEWTDPYTGFSLIISEP